MELKLTKDQFNFKEISAITGVKPYILRFWETEFTELSPITDNEGNKVYNKFHVFAINLIKEFLFDDKLSIPQAKIYFSREVKKYQSQGIEIIEHEFQKNSLIAPVEASSSVDSTSLNTSQNELIEQKLKTEILIEKRSAPKTNPVLQKNQDQANQNVGHSTQYLEHLGIVKDRLSGLLKKIDHLENSRSWS